MELFGPDPDPLTYDEAIAAAEEYNAHGTRTERPGTVRINVRSNIHQSNDRADVFFLTPGILSVTSDFFAKLLFVGISVVSEDSPLPEILVDDTDCDAFEIFALWVGRRERTDTTFREAIHHKIASCFTESGDEDKAAKLLVEKLESMQFKEYIISRSMFLWDEWDNLLAMSEVLVKQDCVRHPILRIILKELAHQYIILNLHLSNLFDDWVSREGLVNAPTSVLAELLTFIDEKK